MTRTCVVFVAFVLLVVPGFAAAQPLAVPFQRGGATLGGEDEATVVAAIAAAEPSLRSGDAVLSRVSERWVLQADPAADAEFVRQQAVNATGRNFFFENDFAAAIAALGPGLQALEADPTVLVFHPDLASATFDAALTLVRSYRAMGDEPEALEAERTIARLMWFATPSASLFPPSVIEKYGETRALMPTRGVRVGWGERDEGCVLWVNGFGSEVRAGDELRFPEGTHVAQLACGGVRSKPRRVDPGSTSLDFDLELDDALTVEGGGARLVPRGDSTATVTRLAAAASVALGEVVFAFGPVPAESGAAGVELVRSDGASSRAVRVQDLTQLSAALHYLRTGEPAGPEVVVYEGQAWPGGPSEGGARRGWALPAAAALGAAGAGAMAVALTRERAVAESLDDVGWCADQAAAGGCEASSLPSLRSDARRARSQANVAWAVSGAALLGAAGALAVWIGDRGEDVVAVGVGVSGVRVAFTGW